MHGCLVFRSAYYIILHHQLVCKSIFLLLPIIRAITSKVVVLNIGRIIYVDLITSHFKTSKIFRQPVTKR